MYNVLMKEDGEVFMPVDESQEHATESTRLLKEPDGEEKEVMVADFRSHLQMLAIRLHMGTLLQLDSRCPGQHAVYEMPTSSPRSFWWSLHLHLPRKA